MLRCDYCHHVNSKEVTQCENCQRPFIHLQSELIEEIVTEQSAKMKGIPLGEGIDSVPVWQRIDANPALLEALEKVTVASEEDEQDTGEMLPIEIALAAESIGTKDNHKLEGKNEHKSAQTSPKGTPRTNPRLFVLRGHYPNREYRLIPGMNLIGRTDQTAVDIDLEDQENEGSIWSSRQHASIQLENNKLIIEDLNSKNGTFVNRIKLRPGQKCELLPNDIIHIGSIQFKVLID